MIGEVVRFPASAESLSVEQGRAAAERALAVPIAERRDRARELRLENPELLMAVCEILSGRMESSPAPVREDAAFFYRFLETPSRRIGEFDEREYFLGELAFLAGAAGAVIVGFSTRLENGVTPLAKHHGVRVETFDIIYVMTAGGPGFASETLNVYTFQVGLFYFHIGYASSLLVILFALVLGVSLLLIKVRRGSW